MTTLPKAPPPELDDATAFNRAAAAAGWPIIADAGCAFAHTLTRELAALWASEAGEGVPAREVMTARKLQPFMRNIAIYERIGEGVQRRYRVRLMGSGIVQYYGELTGKSFEEAVAERFLPRWYGVSDVPLKSRRPVRFVLRADTFDKSYMVAEYLCAPLSSASGLTKFVLLGMVFDGKRTWAEVEAETRAALGGADGA